MNGATPKIFISSTYVDLVDYRRKAIEVVNRYKCLPLAMEHFLAQSKDPETVCTDEIKECDIFIGIYAHRYGFIPEGNAKSITQLEYELAKELGKPCLCFVVDKTHSWPFDLIEIEKITELKDFLQIVQKDLVTTYFTTPSDFEAKLANSLGNHLLSIRGPVDDEQRSPKNLIPIAPTPFIAHPYPLPPNFTGREKEKTTLSNWFHNAAEPVMVLEAIGGMGKSALSWVWLRDEILEKNADVDGVIWWSFYDEPFESFLGNLFYYLTTKEVKVERGALVDQLSTLNSILHSNKFLLVLDGFERSLRGYTGMNAMYIQEDNLSLPQGRSLSLPKGPAAFQQAQGPGSQTLGLTLRQAQGPAATEAEEWDRRQRQPVHPQATKFLQRLTSGHSKILMTTRLFPTPLQDVSGVLHLPLHGLNDTDAVRFLQKEGLQGTRAEMQLAAAVYNNHPLMLKLLSTAIKRTHKQDISDAFHLNLIDQTEPQKILNTSYQLLDAEEQQVATTIAVFRSTFDFDAVKALLPEVAEGKLWDVLCALQQLGFVFCEHGRERFDFHPILRSFLYDHLTSRNSVHQLAESYFQALPAPEKVVTLADLEPVIERYHHLIGAGKFDEAFKLYKDRLSDPIYFQLANYNLDIELKRALFPDGEDKKPRLQNEADQAWTLNDLANAYSLSGQPAQAVPLYLLQNALREKSKSTKNLAIGLGNVAQMAQIHIGQQVAAAAQLRKSILLCGEMKEEFNEAIGHQEWGRILAWQGRWQQSALANPGATGARVTAESELDEAFEFFKKDNYVQSLSVVSAHRAQSLLLQSRLLAARYQSVQQAVAQALEQAGEALQYAQKTIKNRYPYPRDFVQAYWLLGASLLQGLAGKATRRLPSLEIHFYDETFQQHEESLELEKENILQTAERCLSEGLRRCRSNNMVYHEPDLLLAWARLHWLKNQPGDMHESLKEAQQIAERAGYRVKLADIHLFCAEYLLETEALAEKKLLELSTREHLHKAKEYAKDVSEYCHLYQTTDPHFYDNIPEAAMLKRGMTEQERIDNGYWVAYQIAEALEERLDDIS